MLLQMRTITVKKGFADQVIERFSRSGLVEQQEGFIDKTVYLNKRPKDKETQEVVIIVRWESVEAWKNWEKSPEHIAGHRAKKDAPKPEYILDVNMTMLESV